MKLITSIFLIALLTDCNNDGTTNDIFHAQGEMAGEITQTTVILQSRLTVSDTLRRGDLPGALGYARFELSKSIGFEPVFLTHWMKAEARNDFIIKQQVANLEPGSQYYYRLIYGADTSRYKIGETRLFRTLPGITGEDTVSFVVVTGMNYAKFYHGDTDRDKPEITSHKVDKHLGYPALESIKEINPDFVVFTGDNVYYDEPIEDSFRAKTLEQMRKKWHEQFAQPRMIDLFSRVPAYWQKDDHDHRYDDSDTTTQKKPSHSLGVKVFKEQVPVTPSGVENAVTYRTYRINKHLQIWFTEGRDYRSPNNLPDGPSKSIWGNEQKEWLKKTLVESDATFKILISPTPMVGPDHAHKSDNHVNHKGFRVEGEMFFSWLQENKFLDKNFYIVCGDRHWQYHSIHPSGFEEFSCGALIDANSRAGRLPGDPKSTDPNALIKTPYIQGVGENSGGFLNIVISKGNEDVAAKFRFHDENGILLYQATKTAKSHEPKEMDAKLILSR